MTPARQSASRVRLPCVHRGARERVGGPCGHSVHPCGLHGGLCTAVKPCKETGRVCATCPDYVAPLALARDGAGAALEVRAPAPPRAVRRAVRRAPAGSPVPAPLPAIAFTLAPTVPGIAPRPPVLSWAAVGGVAVGGAISRA